MTNSRLKGYYSLDPPVSTDLADHPSPLLVVPESPKKFREFVEFFAYCFKREFHFDFVPFEASQRPGSPGYMPYEVYLFHETAHDLMEADKPTKHRCIGVCGFRWTEWTDVPPSWSCQWVWFHPYFRGRGYLSKAWPQFQEKYGKFHIQEPVSPAMQVFLRKRGHEQP